MQRWAGHRGRPVFKAMEIFVAVKCGPALTNKTALARVVWNSDLRTVQVIKYPTNKISCGKTANIRGLPF